MVVVEPPIHEDTVVDRCHATSRATHVLNSTVHVSLARSRTKGLGLGRVLYSTHVAREVAWHLSATV